MSRIGLVLETSGDRARISTSRRSVCAECAERSSCSFDSHLDGEAPEEVTVLNPIGARVNETVLFDLPGHTELKVSLLIWVVPLIGLIAGAAAGATLLSATGLPRDPATLIGAAAGFALAFGAVILCDRRSARDPNLIPRILKVVKASSCPLPDDGSTSRLKGARPG